MPAGLENDRFNLEIGVAGYEFEDDFRDAFDANWLIFRVVLQSVHGAWRWQVEDAGALTWELDDCVAWLRALNTGQPTHDDFFGFSEPDVSFDVIRNDDGQVIGLRVNLMDEFQPPTKVLVPRENNIVSLRFYTPPEVLSAFADRLEESLAHYPQRGERPKIEQPS
ncbi:MAG: hypothetical protein K8J31_29775 [Anaerolineae bacterium]|nr:hypothetical protein [Anaerolineae bacterium]